MAISIELLQLLDMLTARGRLKTRTVEYKQQYCCILHIVTIRIRVWNNKIIVALNDRVSFSLELTSCHVFHSRVLRAPQYIAELETFRTYQRML